MLEQNQADASSSTSVERRSPSTSRRVPVLAALLLMWTGCTVPVPPAGRPAAHQPENAARLTGTWALADTEFGLLFALFTIGSDGRVEEMCHQSRFAQYGVDRVRLDGLPQTSGDGLTTVATSTVAGEADELMLTMEWTVGVSAIEVAFGEATFGGVLVSPDEASGFVVANAVLPGEEFVDFVPAVAVRISESPGSCLADDHFEPNDSPDQASRLNPGEHAELVGIDADWYAVDVAAGQEVTARIAFDDRIGDLDLEVFDESGEELLTWASTFGGGGGVSLPNDAGTYLVLVEGPGYTIHPRYDLLLEVRDARSDDDFEENDAPEAAASIVSGTHELVVLDDDWFRIEANGAAEVLIRLAFDHASGDLDMELFDGEGVLLDGSDSANDGEIVLGQSETGEFLIHVWGFRGARNDYQMDVSVFTFTSPATANHPPAVTVKAINR